MVQLESCDVLQGLPFAVAIAILRQCVSGLHHLHQLGILHRDLRAANVLVTSADPIHVVIADFGVSHQLSEYAEQGSLFHALGTADGANPSVQVSRL